MSRITARTAPRRKLHTPAARRWATAGLLAGLCLFLAIGCGRDPASSPQTAVVKRGPLTLSVETRGELEAEKSVKVLRPKLYMGREGGRRGGSVKITKLIPEGTDVKPGTLLAELDKADLKDFIRRAESDVREKTADLEKARKTMLVQRDRLKAEVDKLRADLEIKQIELGITESLPTTSDAVAAKTELETAVVLASLKKQDYDPTEKLYKSGHVTQQDLEIAALELKQAEANRARKQIIHDLVMKGADECEKERAALAVRLAKIMLAQAENKLAYETKRLEEKIKAAEADLEQSKFDLKRASDSLEDADVKAPCAGTVMYTRTWQGSGDEKIAEGTALWTYQQMLALPDLNTMVAKVYIEESQMHFVKEGLPAILTMDAIKDVEFHGQVSETANVTLDKSETRGLVTWIYGSAESSGIRVFEVRVKIAESDKRLRPGLNGDVKIIVEEMKDVLSIPVEAVFKRDGRDIAYVKQGRRFEARPIETGQTAEGRVVVKAGLNEGDEVSLVEPEGAL
jgi:multidrug efflux pump subunit AcrA (membrane-fusion protein)